MADETDYISRTLEDVKSQIEAKIADAARLLPTANHLAEMIGAPTVSLADFIADYDDDSLVVAAQPGAIDRPAAVTPVRGGAVRHIKPDAFLGQVPLEAAKKYIGMVGHAAQIDEIAGAVERGGAAVKGADWRDKLEMSLLRSVHDVVKVKDKTYGLVSFYTAAQIEGLRGARRREKPKGKRGGKKRGKPSQPPTHKTSVGEAKAKRTQANKPTDESGAREPDGSADQVH